MTFVARYRKWVVWWLVALTAIVALVLGTVGSVEYLVSQKKYAGLVDAFYRAFQLFALNFYDSGPLPWKLEVARWLAPAATLGALFKSIVSIAGTHSVQWRLVRLTGHVVVTGERSATGGEGLESCFTVAAALGAPQPPIRLSARRILVTAPDMEALATDSGVDRAAAALVDAQSVDEGLAWLHAIHTRCVVTGRSGLDVTVLLPDETMCNRLDGVSTRFEPRLRMAFRTRLDLQTSKFCQALGEAMLRGSVRGSARIELALVGSARLCHATLRRLATQLIAHPARSVTLRALCLGMEDPTGEGVDWSELSSAAPQIDWKVSAAATTDEIVEALRNAQAIGVCCEEAYEALAILDLSQQHDIAERPPTVVFVSSAWQARNVHHAITDDHVVPVGVGLEDELAAAATNPALECMAQAIHRNYLDSNPVASPAAVPWSDLAARYRQSSRLQAESLMFKLLALGSSVEAAQADGAAVSASIEAEIEPLSEAEHMRWMTEKRLQGWTYGDLRNDRLKLHPLLVPYAELAEEEKEKDRAMWRLQPKLLGARD